jgi:hypothetical protein
MDTSTDILPGDGVHRGVPADVYHGWPAINQSHLKIASRSVHHMIAAMHRPMTLTAAMEFGTAVHAAFLEPDAFARDYDTPGPCTASTKDGRPCSRGGVVRVGGAWFCSQHSPDETPDAVKPLTEAARDACVSCCWSLGEALGEAGISTDREAEGVEMSLLWTDPDTGARCKARIDLIDGRTAVDIKTTQDASPDGFRRSVEKYAYDFQAAWYLRGLNAVGVEVDRFVFAAVETREPHAAGLYDINHADLVEAYHEASRNLRKWRDRAKIRKHYTSGVQTLSLSPWARRNHEENE